MHILVTISLISYQGVTYAEIHSRSNIGDYPIPTLRTVPTTVHRWTLLITIVLPSSFLWADGNIIFTDIVATEGAGIEYRRQRSASDAIFDALKAQPTYTFPDAVRTPTKSRGAPGVAILDFDRDGDLDLYVTNGPGAANSLYSNQLLETGTVAFVDVGIVAGVAAIDQDSTGVCYGDIDNDRDHDLYVLGNRHPNRLFENQGDGTFLDITASSGLGGGNASSTSCSMGDIDSDGLLDVAVGNSFDMSTQAAILVEVFVLNEANQLFLNQGGNVFVDVSAASGIQALDLPVGAPPGAATITWAIAMVDFDLDGDVDIFHADDQGALDNSAQGGIDRGFIHIFENDGTGSFTDVTFERDCTMRAAGWDSLSATSTAMACSISLVPTLVTTPKPSSRRISTSASSKATRGGFCNALTALSSIAQIRV